MLIAEDLYLLIADDRTGKLRGDPGSIDHGLAAAVLCDLELLGRLHLGDGTDSDQGRHRLVVDDYTPTGHAVLDRALRTLTPRDRTPARAVSVLRKGLRRAVRDGLVEAGVLRSERTRLFGALPLTRYPAARMIEESSARAAVNQVFVGGGEGDPRAAALIASLAVVGMVPKVVPEVHPMLTGRTIRRRARGYLEACWPARAARRAYLARVAAGV